VQQTDLLMQLLGTDPWDVARLELGDERGGRRFIRIE
jgi:hypothetical protein